MKALAFIAIAAVLGGCGVHHMFEQGPHVQGSGKAKTENRKVGNFSRIVSAGSANCKVAVGPGTAVSVTADDNLLSMIETRVEKGTLIIECKGNFSSRSPIVVQVKTPNLESFASRGAGDSEFTGIKGKHFAAEISGSGNLKGAGQTERATYTIRGSGDMDFLNLRARNAEATISGSGEITVWSDGVLDAAIRGSGSITYSGNPSQVNKSISGSGDISAR